MKNCKVIARCWTCNSENDITHLGITEYNVKCDKCGGYVVSPSGKIQSQIIPAVKVFEFDDGEQHWIAAETQEAAEKYFNGPYDGYPEYTVKEVSREMLFKPCITSEDSRAPVSLAQIIFEHEAAFPDCIACSVC